METVKASTSPHAEAEGRDVRRVQFLAEGNASQGRGNLKCFLTCMRGVQLQGVRQGQMDVGQWAEVERGPG